MVFLIPTQLGYHFWPDWTYVFGLKVDHLSPTIYLTDILILLYIILSIWKRRIFEITKNINWIFLCTFILFATLNTGFAFNVNIAFYKWLKIVFLTVFAFFVSIDEEIEYKNVAKTLCFSTITFSTIGLAQFIKGGTIGGLFYLLGERSFNVTTPGIALMNFLGRFYLRIYSTFSHPNSLAGFFTVVLPMIIFWKTSTSFDKGIKFLSIFLTVVAILLSFSRSAVIAALLVLTFFLLRGKKMIPHGRIIFTIFSLIFFASLVLPVFSLKGIFYKNKFTENTRERIILTTVAGREFSEYPILGVGLNNFIPLIPRSNFERTPFWFLQPVHNIYLLLLVETGIVGASIFFFYFSNLLKSCFKGDRFIFFSLIIILITGFFDHYWLTLQQNLILFFLILGLSKNRVFK